MRLGGWIFLISSMVFVWGLTFWCFRRVLQKVEANPPKSGG